MATQIDLNADGTKMNFHSNTFVIDEATNRVGIGTDSPDKALHIVGPDGKGTRTWSYGTDCPLILDNAGATDAGTQLQFISDDGGSGSIMFGDNSDSNAGEIRYLHGDDKLAFRTADIDRMAINSSGNVGIGTSSPSTSLHIRSTTPQIRFTDSDAGADSFINASSSDGNLFIQADVFDAKANTLVRIDIDGDPKMTIDSSGNVGIGATPSANCKLEVNGIIASKGGGELTIASGAITVTHNHHKVATESGAGTDDLETINGGVDGQILVLRASISGDTVKLIDDTGNLRLAGGDFSMDTGNDTITLICVAGSLWFEISRSDNA